MKSVYILNSLAITLNLWGTLYHFSFEQLEGLSIIDSLARWLSIVTYISGFLEYNKVVKALNSVTPGIWICTIWFS